MRRKHPKAERDEQLETLDDLSHAIHYNRWIFNMMHPFLGKRVLEVGCGIGNITRLLAVGRKVLAVDIHPGYLAQARKNLRDAGNVSFERIDLGKNLLSVGKFRPDTIVCVNVFEHIEGDVRFLRECFKLLPAGGRLLIFVPALPSLFGSMDTHYGHYRRYTRTDLEDKAAAEGFTVLKCRYLNLLGIFGWWWNGKILKKAIIPKAQILLYDQVIRWIGPVEKWFPKPVGLSLFLVGEKNNG
jgi:SAM-dependent methyltransferase